MHLILHKHKVVVMGLKYFAYFGAILQIFAISGG